MKVTINRKVYDTEKADYIGGKFVGEFGEPGGYEEQMFVTKAGQHFIYGAGGPESPYAEPEIKLISDDEAKSWNK
jgi:hypothetical protein